MNENMGVYMRLEARVGIEPTHKGFADLSLTAWVPRLGQKIILQKAMMKPTCAVARLNQGRS